MCRRDLVTQLPDGLDGQGGGGVRVDHRGLPDHARIAVERRANGQLAHADERPVQRGALRRQIADPLGGQAARADGARDLHGVPRRKVGDQPGIDHVGVDAARCAGHHAVDDLRGVFGGLAGQVERLAGEQAAPGGVVVVDVLRADPEVVADRDAQPVDLRVVVQVPGHVLRGVLAGLGREVAEPPVHVHPHPPAQLEVLVEQGVEPRIERLPPMLEPQQPGLVIDPGAGVVDLLVRDAEQRGQVVHGPEDRVAEPGDVQVGGDRAEVGDVHRHRIRVVEQPRVRADLAHVGRDPVQHRERAQRAEDPADAERVRDGLPQAVLRRDLEVPHGRRVHADLDRVDHEVGAGQSRAPIQVGGDPRRRVQLRGGPAGDQLRRLEAFGVDVVQGQGDAT